MTKLVWSAQSQVRYESGVDRGVLYPINGPGVVWNGLTSVEESFDGGESNSYYFDGVKYLEKTSPKTFQATISAFSAPREFGPCIGEVAVVPGFILTRQPRVRFGFSYRTLVGDFGYKIHVVYNALASQKDRPSATLNDSPTPDSRSWQVDATPPLSDTYRPSAHFVIDSTKTDPAAVASIEDILYGTTATSPRIPSADELVDLVGFWEPYLIIPDDISGLSDLEPGLGDLTKSRVAGLYRTTSNSRLTQTDVGGLYRLEQ